VASYSPVYSAQFLVYTDSTPNTSYDVPAGMTAVIRDYTHQTNFGVANSQLAIGNSLEAPACVVAELAPDGEGAYAQWTGRIVVPGGGFIELFISSIDVGNSLYVGGYLLRNVAP
jgi:hypothetical protein